ncbi:glycine betaine ABC transporter substrate-binding protein [Aliamphritea spongicola]|nr:glycine betaine ABC transporter substrate-binding protein [Aliamphritea spongicola]
MLVASLTTATISVANECQTVQLAEPGWTDLAFTSGVAQVLLKGLGYEASVDILGMSVMLEAMKNKDIDVMMGYWDPAMDTYIKSYIDEGSIEKVAVNLEGLSTPMLCLSMSMMPG